MGIDVHAFNFLRLAAGTRGLGRVATIGRQALYVSRFRLKRLLHLDPQCDYGDFCEYLLRNSLGATLVESFDNSGYEQATHIADLNKPLGSAEAYDTVFDGGCLEHIYNVPQALANISQLCAVGGQILHSLPANNHCGHGFWQFSPELFFSLYSPANGYGQTHIYMCSSSDEKHWYEVRKPSPGQRVCVTSNVGLYLLVRTVREGVFSHSNVQQSDYVYSWARDDASGGRLARRIKAWVRQSSLLPVARMSRAWLSRVSTQSRLSGRNPHLVKRPVAAVLRGARE